VSSAPEKDGKLGRLREALDVAKDQWQMGVEVVRHEMLTKPAKGKMFRLAAC
jgi:hypothetical protein